MSWQSLVQPRQVPRPRVCEWRQRLWRRNAADREKTQKSPELLDLLVRKSWICRRNSGRKEDQSLDWLKTVSRRTDRLSQLRWWWGRLLSRLRWGQCRRRLPPCCLRRRRMPRTSRTCARSVAGNWSRRVRWTYTCACIPTRGRSPVWRVVAASEQTEAWRGTRYCWYNNNNNNNNNNKTTICKVL